MVVFSYSYYWVLEALLIICIASGHRTNFIIFNAFRRLMKICYFIFTFLYKYNLFVISNIDNLGKFSTTYIDWELSSLLQPHANVRQSIIIFCILNILSSEMELRSEICSKRSITLRDGINEFFCCKKTPPWIKHIKSTKILNLKHFAMYEY